MEEKEEPVSKKKKKSGFAYKQDRSKKLLKESARKCSKITNFCFTPKLNQSSSTQTNEEKSKTNLFSTLHSNQTFASASRTSTEENEDKLRTIEDNVTPWAIDLVEESQAVASVLVDQQEHLCSGTDSSSSGSLEEEMNYFKKPANNNLLPFFSYHPIKLNTTDLPFIDKEMLYVSKDSGNHRHWLTFNRNSSEFFCHICLVFSSGSSVFCTGFKDYRHIHQRAQEHEGSNTHKAAVDAFVATKCGKDTYSLLNQAQLEKRKTEVEERKHVVGCVIDVLKFIGKQGLPFRGSVESAFTLEDENVNHGNFLEMIRFLSNYDVALQKHLIKVMEQSKLNHERAEKRKAVDPQSSKSVGRGTLVSFVGKNTILKILHIIVNEMKSQIASDIKTAETFSIMMDTTMDISTVDQCAFVARFVKGCEVSERLIALKPVTSTSSNDLFESLKLVLNDYGIPIENCVANAFDGASNMSGQYNGVTAKLSEAVPNHLHTWCYAHVLNLVICDTAECTTVTISFFGLLQKAQVFFKESFKRLQTYLAENPHFKLEAIGATRWRSRSDAAVKIFGRIDMWTKTSEPGTAKCVYLELVVALFKISNSANFNTKVRSEAEGLMKNFTAFETVFAAMMFLQIFKITTPVSDYLQTKDLDYAQAWRLIESAVERLKSVRGKFEETVNAAKRFMSIQIENLTEKVNTDGSVESLELEEDFKEKRIKKIKKQAGERCEHEHTMQTRQDEVKVEVFYRVLDTAIQVMERRFAQHKNLYLDLSFFDPKRFNNTTTLPPNALNKISELLPNIDKAKLEEELESFAQVWAKLNKNVTQQDYEEKSEQECGLGEEFGEQFTEEKDPDPIADDSVHQKCSLTRKCTSCIKCAFRVIFEYNMYSMQYTEMFKVYKYLLTLPMTQVTCERVFSKLKIVKTRLRSTLTSENLESLILMSVEKDIVNTITHEKIIKKLCESSSEMRRLLEV